MALKSGWRRFFGSGRSSEGTPRPVSPFESDVETIRALSDAQLAEWENRGIVSLGRASDRLEAEADERQDAATSLSFPLHWTSAGMAWRYLFDLAIAGELLAARPDDLVLDFAAGTSWATELLARLGIRPVSLDLSLEMLRRGRQRLLADTRIEFRDDAAFVAGRGQELPFVDESFEGVLCLNALHHQPAYAVALREIYRVLKPGGRAVFSEPGTAHAEAPLSEFRMREESVVEKPVWLPHVHRLALEAGFTRMTVVPLRAAATYTLSYTATPQDREKLVAMWDDTLKHSPREHARFALHKGDDPPADTLLPPQQLTGRLRAAIQIESVGAEVQQGATVTDRLRITNTGSLIWRARGRRFGGQVTCGLKVCSERGEVLREDLGRTPLPHDVRPRGEISIDMKIVADLPPGRYELRYDMVVEGVTWFEFQGSECPRRSLRVTDAP